MHLSRRSYVLIGSTLLVILALGLAATTYAVRSERVTLPAETPIHVTLDQALASNQSRSGDHFEAIVSEPVIVEGKTVVPQGAPVKGLVVESHKSGSQWNGCGGLWRRSLFNLREILPREFFERVISGRHVDLAMLPDEFLFGGEKPCKEYR